MPDHAKHVYRATLQATDLAEAVLESPGHSPLVGGPPPQFGGSDEWWSPEDLLVSSASLCLYTTYRAMAARKKLTIGSYRCEAEGTLTKTAAGFVFDAIRLSVAIEVAAADVERARALMDEAKRWCIVSNSLRCPVEVAAAVIPLAEGDGESDAVAAV